ncbi:MAG TPA: hydrogenase maturation nickel metallochaperone HypA, partial [Bacteroidota bacterium]|nr:hydrogenase maturation nickel metallochaperone HypA [Bacteroidota bacterium]
TLEIERVPFRLYCSACQGTFGNDFGVVVCPNCKSIETKVVSGTEIQIESIELTEDGAVRGNDQDNSGVSTIRDGSRITS